MHDIAWIERSHELSQLNCVLNQRCPAVIVITGELGIGKTILLRTLADSAMQLDWQVVGLSTEHPLSVTRFSTPQTFLELLSTELAQLPNLQSEDELAEPAQLAMDQSDEDNEIAALLERAYHKSPLLILVDEYQPTPEMGAWFCDSFLASVQTLDAPIVIIVAERPVYLTAIRRLATKTLELKPLRRRDIRAYLKLHTQNLQPPLGAEELKVYVEQIAARPYLLAPLMRSLQLLKQPEATTA